MRESLARSPNSATGMDLSIRPETVVLPSPEIIYDNEWRQRVFDYYTACRQRCKNRVAFDPEKVWMKHRRGVEQEMGMARRVSHWMPLSGRRVLVVGSYLGTEAIAYALCGARVTAVDLDEKAIELSRELARRHRVQIDVRCLDATSLPFPDESFDYVSCAQVIEHLRCERQPVLLTELWRVLAPGGLLWIDTPNQLNWKDRHDTNLPFIHWLPRRLKLPLARALSRALAAEELSFGPGEVGLHYLVSFFALRRLFRRLGPHEVLTHYRGFANVEHYAAERRFQGRAGRPFFGLKLVFLRVLLSVWDWNWFGSIRLMVRKVPEATPMRSATG